MSTALQNSIAHGVDGFRFRSAPPPLFRVGYRGVRRLRARLISGPKGPTNNLSEAYKDGGRATLVLGDVIPNPNVAWGERSGGCIDADGAANFAG